MNYRYLMIVLLIFSFLLQPIPVSSQVNDIEVEFSKKGNIFTTTVKNPVGRDIIFEYGYERSEIHDIYLDSLFCTIIYEEETLYTLSAAYLDNKTDQWIIDYPYVKFFKHDKTSVFEKSIHDIEILDGKNLVISYSASGPAPILNRLFGTTDFPSEQKLILSTSGIYNTQNRILIVPNYNVAKNSPRPINLE